MLWKLKVALRNVCLVCDKHYSPAICKFVAVRNVIDLSDLTIEKKEKGKKKEKEKKEAVWYITDWF